MITRRGTSRRKEDIEQSNFFKTTLWSLLLALTFTVTIISIWPDKNYITKHTSCTRD